MLRLINNDWQKTLNDLDNANPQYAQPYFNWILKRYLVNFNDPFKYHAIFNELPDQLKVKIYRYT